jgi:hypothetical protein
VVRFDFLAKIKTADGYKSIIIEMQKAQLATDIRRFRRYIGAQYQSKSNIYTDEKKKKHERRIYCIFFLGEGLNVPDVPVLTVTNQVKDRSTGQALNLHHEFIDSLHHQSWIVQIPNLKKHRCDDLEKLLSVFDQNRIKDNDHILNINEDDFPEEYRHIIRRLRQAAESEEIAEQMIAEDELISDFQYLERQIAEQDEMLDESKKQMEEKDNQMAEKDKQMEEIKKQMEEKDKQMEELKRQLNLNK